MQVDKPLWIFFNLLRKRSTSPLAVDQYIYFLNAFKALSADHFNNLKELREFTKIFWLKNANYEPQYNQLFAKTSNWEKVKLDFFSLEVEVDTTVDTKATTEIEDKTEKEGGKVTEVEDVDKPPSPAPITEPESDFVDFDLIISEVQTTPRPSFNQKIESVASFELSSQAIMPFYLRFFAQRLRRKVETPIKEFTLDLDVEAMIETLSSKGFIEEIIYETKSSSKSNIILLADRFGSMLGYEYLEEHLAGAIQSIPDCNFEHYYFYNLPPLTKDEKHYKLLTTRGSQSDFNTEKHQWNSDSWFFIYSDAGAHSGGKNRKRIRDTIRLCNYLRHISRHIYWINPVSARFMGKSTSKELRRIIPMIFPIEEEWNQFFNQV